MWCPNANKHQPVGEWLFMCAIAGFINFSSFFKNPEDVLHDMARALAHRGPDASGIWFHAPTRTGLAHTRLKIIDCTDAIYIN